MKAKSTVTRTIGCPGTGLVMPTRSPINLRASVLIISFARMMPQLRGRWLWHGQPYILLAGLKPLPLTCHHATHHEFEHSDEQEL